MVDDIRPHPKRPVKRVVPKPIKVRRVIDEPTFVPPDAVHDSDEPELKEIANEDDIPNPVKTAGFGHEAMRPVESKRPQPLAWLKARWFRLSKRNKILIAAASLLLIGGSASAAAIFWPKPPPPPKPVPVVVKKVEPPKPTTEASHLTGLQVGFDINKLPVTGVMIENSPDARPQSGLVDAGVVFEAVAEGGITRFLALFQDTKPGYVGPVRSARPYYIRYLLGFDANYAHAGGSPVAIADIASLSVKDMDQFYNGGSYDRVSNRYAPHNLYTSIDRLLALGASKGYTSSTYTPIARKAEKKIDTPAASAIDIAISSSFYNVHYTYDTANNSYLRSEGGQAHTDEKSGKQINPKVVAVVVTDKGTDPDGIHSVYRTSGSGQAFIFQDGDVIKGTWSKPDDRSQIQFKNAAGEEQKLNAGQTWITLVGDSSAVTFNP